MNYQFECTCVVALPTVMQVNQPPVRGGWRLFSLTAAQTYFWVLRPMELPVVCPCCWDTNIEPVVAAKFVCREPSAADDTNSQAPFSVAATGTSSPSSSAMAHHEPMLSPLSSRCDSVRGLGSKLSVRTPSRLVRFWRDGRVGDGRLLASLGMLDRIACTADCRKSRRSRSADYFGVTGIARSG